VNASEFYRLNKFLLVFLLGWLVTSCTFRQGRKIGGNGVKVSTKDAHSYANTHEVKTTHLHLDLEVSFKHKNLYGVARHTLKNLSGTQKAIFDSKHLLIQKVTLGKEGKERETGFVIGPMDKDSLLGQPLIVDLEKSTTQVNIYYQTTEKSTALAWVDANQTESGQFPMMYTQGQAIHTRSWIPLQDSPSNRFTYSAKIHVKPEFLVLMSANNPTTKNTKGDYAFSMPQAIPSYLMALSVGDYAYHAYTDKVGVYAEKAVMEKASQEFIALPKMFEAAQKLFGPYQWGKYDLLIQHKSFPFGGMENPKLSFINPTIIAGDKSLVSVIAHELAHSWSGNLVTNESWEDFWLNEGITVYIEHRIMEELYGKETVQMLETLDYMELMLELKGIAQSNHPKDSRLHLSLKNRDPDEGMTSVAYVKGALFLKSLEKTIGRDKLDPFFIAYFRDFRFKPMTSEGFENYLKTTLLEPNKFTFNSNEWIYLEGLPNNCYIPHTNKLEAMKTLAAKTNRGEDIFAPVNKVKWVEVVPKNTRRRNQNPRFKKVTYQEKLDVRQFGTQEWQYYIRSLDPTLPVEVLNDIDQYMSFTKKANAEIKYEWFLVNIKRQNKTVYPALKEFLKATGRRKYILPLYEALCTNPSDKPWALSVFKEAKGGYHAIAQQSVADIFSKKP
jgi:leukotriene-A4 hydrolase